MEAKGRRNNKKGKVHSPTGSATSSEAEIRKRIEKLTLVTGSNYEPQRSVRLPSPAPVETRVPSGRRIRNVNLYDEDPVEMWPSSDAPDDYVDDHEITAAVRITNGGIDYSNRRLERRYGARNEEKQKEPDSPPKLQRHEPSAEEWPSLPSSVVDKKKFKKNVAITSLLNPQREESNEINPLSRTSKADRDSADNVGGNSSDCHFTRDSVDPDFFYRKTTVDDSSSDFTVEHVGHVKIVGPRTYQIRNFKDEDIAFRPRNKSRNRKTHQN